MALPRAAALAEVGWSAAARRRWPDFLERLAPMFARYRALGLTYADSVFAPAAQISRMSGGFSLTLSNQAHTGTAARGRDSLHSRWRGTLLRIAALCGAADRAARHGDSRRRLRRLRSGVAHLGEAFRCAHRAAPRQSRARTLAAMQSACCCCRTRVANAPLAVDIMNPCWIDRAVDLSAGPRVVAAVAPLPFNYEIGADAAKIRVGGTRTAEGELEIHADGCDTPAIASLPLARGQSVRRDGSAGAAAAAPPRKA